MIVDKLLMLLGIKYDPSGARKAERDVKGLDRGARRAQTSFAGLGSAAAGAFAYLGGIGAVLAVGTGLVRSVANAEALEASLVGVTGSAEAAAEAMEFLRRKAEETPFQLEELAKGFRKLKAFGLDPSERAITAYGDLALTMGGNFNQMVEAVADATTGEFERLKELGFRYEKMGNRVKLTYGDITRTVGINAAEIQAFLIEMGEMPGVVGAMDRQSQTLVGRWSTFKDKIIALAVEVGEAGFKDALKDGLELLQDLAKILIPLAKAIGIVLGGALKLIILQFKALERILVPIRDLLKSLLPQELLDRLDETEGSAKRLMKLLAIVFTPILVPLLLVEDFIGFLQGKDSVLGRFVARFREADGAIGMVARAIDKLRDPQFWSDLRTMGVETWNAIRDAAVDIFESYILPYMNLLELAWDSLEPRVQRVLDAVARFRELLQPIVDRIREAREESYALNAPWRELKKGIVEVGEALRDYILETIENSIINTTKLADIMLNVLGKAIEHVNGLIIGMQLAFEAVPKAAQQAWREVLNWLQGKLNESVVIVNDILAGLNKVPGIEVGPIGTVDLTGSSRLGASVGFGGGGGTVENRSASMNTNVGKVEVNIEGSTDMGREDLQSAVQSGVVLGLDSGPLADAQQALVGEI